MNGREWLARQLDAKGVGYVRADNALLRIDELNVAGELCERFAHRAWPRFLDALARRVNIHLPAIAKAEFRSYYWCLDQAEVATDVMFCDRRSLTAVLPDLMRHASLNMSSVDVLRFLGRKPRPSLKAEVMTDTKGRPRAGGSSTAWPATRSRSTTRSRSCGLRPPSIIHVSSGSSAFSLTSEAGANGGGAHGQGRGQRMALLPGRHRCQPPLPRRPGCGPLKGEGVAALDALCRSKTKHGRHHARFNPLTPADRQLFRAVLAGDHAISGFRNTDLVRRLYPRPPLDSQEAHRRCARVSRLIAKLRGHGLVAKAPRARLYRPTPYGYRVIDRSHRLPRRRLPQQLQNRRLNNPSTPNRHAQRANPRP